MRINIQENPKSKGCRVTVNGQEVSELCFEADDEQGYALCYRIEQRFESSVRFAREKDEMIVDRLEGRVEIIIPEGKTREQVAAHAKAG